MLSTNTKRCAHAHSPRSKATYADRRAPSRTKEAYSSAISQKCTKRWARAWRCWKEYRCLLCGSSTRKTAYLISSLTIWAKRFTRREKSHSSRREYKKTQSPLTKKAIPFRNNQLISQSFRIKQVRKLSNTSRLYILQALCWSRETKRTQNLTTNLECCRTGRIALTSPICLFTKIHPRVCSYKEIMAPVSQAQARFFG